MRWISRCQRIRIGGGLLCMFLLGSNASAGGPKVHKYRYSDVDIPVSLGVGTIRTPEFSVVAQWYDIMIQVEKPLPFRQMQCMMGVTSGPLELKDCRPEDPLLRATWTVCDGEQVVDQGISTSSGDAKFDDKHIFKFLGSFTAEAGKKYVVEVKFTQDGVPLNVANPRLIVIQHRHN
jgi:hypothetical protein